MSSVSLIFLFPSFAQNVTRKQKGFKMFFLELKNHRYVIQMASLPPSLPHSSVSRSSVVVVFSSAFFVFFLCIFPWYSKFLTARKCATSARCAIRQYGQTCHISKTLLPLIGLWSTPWRISNPQVSKDQATYLKETMNQSMYTPGLD